MSLVHASKRIVTKLKGSIRRLGVRFGVVILGARLALACGPSDPVLSSTQLLMDARAQPGVAAFAPGELRAAEEALAQAQRAMNEAERVEAAARAATYIEQALSVSVARRSEVERAFDVRESERATVRQSVDAARASREASLHNGPDRSADVESFELIDGDDVHARLRAHEPLLFLDVRGRDAWALAHAVGTSPTSLMELTQRNLPAQTIVLMGAQGASSDVADAALALRSRGLRPAVLRGGLQAWQAAGLPMEGSSVRSHDEAALMDVATLAASLKGTARPLVVDVRPERLYLAGHIPGAVRAPLGRLSGPTVKEQKKGDEDAMQPAERGTQIAGIEPELLAAVPAGGSEVVVVGVDDVSARAAASALLQAGRRSVYRLDGGVRAWAQAGLPLERARGPSKPAASFPPRGVR